jgi:hypothetical protein
VELAVALRMQHRLNANKSTHIELSTPAPQIKIKPIKAKKRYVPE